MNAYTRVVNAFTPSPAKKAEFHRWAVKNVMGDPCSKSDHEIKAAYYARLAAETKGATPL